MCTEVIYEEVNKAYKWPRPSSLLNHRVILLKYKYLKAIIVAGLIYLHEWFNYTLQL